MLYNYIGKSPLQISSIGIGTMSLAGNEQLYKKIIDAAIEYGINYFDTADLYDKGLNEELLGKTFKEKRKKIILATKVGNQWRPDGSGFNWKAGKKYILEGVEKSLQRLQTDYIDLYQLHGGTIEDPIDDIIEAFEILKQQGKILHYGISSIRPNVIREYVKRSGIISVMMQYSLLDRRPEENCLALLQSNNISVLSRGVLAQGLFINKTSKDYLGYSAIDVQTLTAAVHSISGEQRTPAQTAIQFVLQQPGITAAVVGIRTMEQLKEVAKTTETPQLKKEEITMLKQIIKPKLYEIHR